MKGTEKQVAWAEEIKKSYVAAQKVLEDAIEILSDLTTVDVESVGDPLDPKPMIIKKYVRSITGSHRASMDTAFALHTSDMEYSEREALRRPGFYKRFIAEGLDNNTAMRLGQAEEYKQVLGWLKEAIDTQDDAKFWINHRF